MYPVICVCMCRNIEVQTQSRSSRDQEKLLKILITDEKDMISKEVGFFPVRKNMFSTKSTILRN